ncbi:T6SS immunity protein Tli3 family protein [Ralstonia sp. 25C]|uniref:T6SS immunity protein Tli3 family protein n=1 Tax=Ralstonia sp. 25C TaxID=3447363 RepID=UPI003F74EBA0
MTAHKFKQFAPMRSALLTATTLLLSLAGCSLSPVDPAAAAIGFGDTISDKALYSIARPPIQVVYRFDDHRYIENDPGPGFNLPCQGELFYVDEALGIRTQTSGNKHGNPREIFKVVDSPYVVARNDMAIYVSFDKGRTFKTVPDVPGGVDVVVVGDRIYMGSDGFTEGSIDLYVIKPDTQKIELQYTAQKPIDDPYQIHRFAASGFPVPEPDPRYAELKKAAREHVNMRSTHQDSTQFFSCKRDLPWRPSINRERQLQKQQQQTLSTANAS